MSEWIPKDLWMATQFACKLIRENHWFNKDCQTAADCYGVNVEDVMAQVRKRQSAGQKRANASRPKKRMKWFVLLENHIGNHYCGNGDYIVCKGYSANAVENRCSHADWGRDFVENEVYAKVVSTHQSKQEAIENVKKLAMETYGENWKYNVQIRR